MDSAIKSKYLSNPNQCPYCNSKELHSFNIQRKSKSASCEVLCKGCVKRWVDVYTLTGSESKQLTA